MLELFAVFFTIQNNSYHRSKFVNSANFITGGIYKRINNFKEYIRLKDENIRLAEENVYLKNLLDKEKIIDSINEKLLIGTVNTNQKYFYISSKIINNEYNRSNNYITINSGENKGIASDMGVINSKGIIGITKSVSNKYSTVLSVLNINSKINIKLLKSNYFGSLSWNAKDYQTVQFLDLPVQANIKIGDTVITGGRSTIFPEGIPVGTIKDFNVVNNNYEFININLFNDMSALGYVEIIKNFDKEQIKNLEEKSTNE
ncbi:MAG: rod shape-determining protein MreC [Bacteroidota bacterium]